MRKRSARWSIAGVLGATCAVLVGTIGTPALAAPNGEGDDPALAQTVTNDEVVAPTGSATVISQGHVDMGPLMVDGKLQFYARDDTADHPVWRNLDDVVFSLGDAAKQVLPESGEYNFTGAQPGQTVYAVPQNQIPGVVWLGWNTQSPAVTENVQRGVTFEYVGHQGPGAFSVFLQSGGFGQPQLLWDSQKNELQPIWVDLKTHTHANWVFTEPGVHLVRMQIKVKMLDGTEASAPATLRFAVGVDPAQARNATWDESQTQPKAADDKTATETKPSAQERNEHSMNTVTMVTIGLFAAALILALAAIIIRKRNAAAREEARRNA
ncbi:choice-of-anchor M domain-containing protein [Trueperella sp. LYQ143]|uniref:choice-of-anchor M domain-containing protein n=1 Tax=unclassified Trueperella TaxID=2630174 RepID=UPI0039835D85